MRHRADDEVVALSVEDREFKGLLMAQLFGIGERIGNVDGVAEPLQALDHVKGPAVPKVGDILLERQPQDEQVRPHAQAPREPLAAEQYERPQRERAEEDAGQPEFRLLAHHLNALLARSEDMIGGLRRLHRHVAHDLRGPLMVARRHLEALDAPARNEPLVAEAQTKIVTADKRCRMLLGIIDAEVSRGAGADTVDPAARIRQLIDDMFVYLGDDKDLAFELDAGTPACVRVAADLFDRMIENVLGNAVKFADPGSTVRCIIANEGGQVRIAVDNDGPGIEPNRIERIFEPGYSSGGADSHGLGLAFVKTVALRAGGDVRAFNRGGGFRIEISLPAITGDRGA